MSRRTDPRQRTTAHRPLLQAGGRRSLSNVGGPVETFGDPALAKPMAEAFAVRAGERDATLTHPFHAYPARLHPDVARRLVSLARSDKSPPTIVDPCCGSGTVLVEAMVSGARAVGTDLSPLAVELARLKTRVTTSAERKHMVETTHAIARQATTLVRARAEFPSPNEERRWYPPHTLAEVAALASIIDDARDGFERDALRMLLSSVLVKVSRQRSDSDPAWVEKTIEPGLAIHFFARKSLELARCLEALAAATPRNAPPVEVRIDDANSLATIADATADLIVTSPPYANTYDYVSHHTRRYSWLRLDASALRANEIGAQRWFDEPEAGVLRFRREMASMCASFARILRSGGLAFVIIADGSVEDQPLPGDEAIIASVRGTGLTLAARVSQARPTFDRTSSRAFQKRPKREHLLALRRS